MDLQGPDFSNFRNPIFNYRDPNRVLKTPEKLHKVLKKYGNSKFSRYFIQILFFTADDEFANRFFIVFHE